MKTGYHAVYAQNYYDGIDAAAANGFNFVQFDLGVPQFFLNNLYDNELKQICDYAKDRSIELTFHSPGDNVSLFCDYPLIKKGILDEFGLILEKANIINARHITFHAGIYPQFKKSGEKADNSRSEYYTEVLYNNLKYLTDRCGSVLINLENFRFDNVIRNTVRKLINDGNHLFLTLDTQKLYNANYEIINEDFNLLKEFKDNIREIHIHDLNDTFGAHQIVGTGVVDFGLIRQFANENTYINFEVRPVEAAKISNDNLFNIWIE